MTVTYTHEVANARFCGFSRLLGRWKGSVYKIFYKEFALYMALYMLFSLLYRYVLDEERRKTFEKVCLEFHQYTSLIPVAFVLGFYVTLVVGRWWNQFILIPFPDRVMYLVVGNLHGADTRGRMMRRTLMRYLNLSQLIVYQAISTATRKRFPNTESFLKTGAMTRHEYSDFEAVKSQHLKYWVPLIWFTNLLSKAKMEGRILSDVLYTEIMKEMMQYRSGLGMLLAYDWVTLPLVYTQVVTLAVYSYFASTLLGRQFLRPLEDQHHIDMVIPYFTICEFFFYMGLLKVGEVLINPFGEDDDDFNLNEIIDRNTEVPMLAVDNLYLQLPRLTKDRFWDVDNPKIPYAPDAHHHEPFTGSTVDMRESRADLGKPRNTMEPLIEQVDENGNKQYDNRQFQVDPDDDDVDDFDDVMIDDDLLSNIIDDDDDEEEETIDANSSVDDVSRASLRHDRRDDSLQSDDDDVELDVGDVNHNIRDSNDQQSEGSSSKMMTPTKRSLSGSGKLITSSRQSSRSGTPAPAHTTQPPSADHSGKKNLKLNMSAVKQNLNQSLAGPSSSGTKVNRRMTKNQRDNNLHKRIQQLQQAVATEEDSDRENIYKRMQIQVRNNKRLRSVSDSQRLQKRALLHSHYPNMASPDIVSDSPFGSVASFATSVPSPKQLRWAFRPNRATSISGNDTNSEMSASSFSVSHASSHQSVYGGWSPGNRRMSESSDHHQQPNKMVFHDEVLRRLQVVSKSKRTRSRESISNNNQQRYHHHQTPQKVTFRPSPATRHSNDDDERDDVTLVTTSSQPVISSSSSKRSVWASLRSRFQPDRSKKNHHPQHKTSRDLTSSPSVTSLRQHDVELGIRQRSDVGREEEGNPRIVINDDVGAPLVTSPSDQEETMVWEHEITPPASSLRDDEELTTNNNVTSSDQEVTSPATSSGGGGDEGMPPTFTPLDPIPEGKTLEIKLEEDEVEEKLDDSRDHSDKALLIKID